MVRPVERWGDIELATISFGQGMTVTPLQMVAGVSAIAGGGIYAAARRCARVAPTSRARCVTRGRARRPPGVSPGGGAHHARDHARRDREGRHRRGWPSTATPWAARPAPRRRSTRSRPLLDGKWVSSFVGFAPLDDPRLVIFVVVDEPQGAHWAARWPAPIFKEMAEALRYLHVPPDGAAPPARWRRGRQRADAAHAAADAAGAAPADRRRGRRRSRARCPTSAGMSARETRRRARRRLEPSRRARSATGNAAAQSPGPVETSTRRWPRRRTGPGAGVARQVGVRLPHRVRLPRDQRQRRSCKAPT